MRHAPFAVLVALAIAASFGTAAAAPACKVTKAETDIARIRIGDPASAVAVIGARMKGYAASTEQDKDAQGVDQSFPYLRFATRNGREEVKLFMHYGDVVDSYNEIEVSPATASKAKRLPVEAFVTERGVRLGITEQALVALLGSCFTREPVEGGATMIKYQIADENHALLKRANMPSYYAHYTFRAGKLAHFKFGFEYP